MAATPAVGGLQDQAFG